MTDDIKCETQIIRLQVDKILDEVPMTNRWRNLMNDIKQRCETINRLSEAE